MILVLAAALALSAPAAAQPIPLVFGVHDDHHRETLWTSDGTSQGTRPLGHFCRVVVGPRLEGAAYFVASDCRKETWLWKTDGTRRGTVALKMILAGELRAWSFAVVERTVMVYAASLSSPPRLWRSDGTAGGTAPIDVKGVDPDAGICGLAGWQGAFWFWVLDHSLERPNPRIWRSDGTTAGTRPVAAFPPDQDGLNASGECQLVPFKDRLYFTFRHEGLPSELWRTNGTLTGTALVRSFGQGALQALTVSGDTLFFRRVGADGEEWWRTDGVPGHERTVKQLPPRWDQQGEVSAVVGGGTLYFTAFGRQLWKSDGTGTGTSLVKDFGTGSNDDYGGLALLGEHRGTVYLMLGEPEGFAAKALWRTDGTARGTAMVKRVGEPEVFRKTVRR